MRAFVIGRFQPFHNGHLEIIQEIAGDFEAIVIGIGSAQYSHTLDNPFTAGERHFMISTSIEESGIHNYYLVPIIDINRYAVWVSHIRSLIPPIDVVLTNNPLTRRLFEEEGYEVRASPMYDRKRYSGREIRGRIINNESWHDLVPTAVVKVIDEIDGVKRLRELATLDYDIDQDDLEDDTNYNNDDYAMK